MATAAFTQTCVTFLGENLLIGKMTVGWVMKQQSPNKQGKWKAWCAVTDARKENFPTRQMARAWVVFQIREAHLIVE